MGKDENRVESGGIRLLKMALEIERIRKTDPDHYARIIRKLEQLQKIERRSRK